MHENQIWDRKCSKIASQNGLPPLIFWCLVWHCLRSCLWEAPGPQKSCPNRKKTQFLRYFFHGLLHLSQPTFCLARRIHSESHCNYSRLDLYLPSLGKDEDGHTVSADCLGELFGGAAMTRRRRLRLQRKGYKMIFTILNNRNRYQKTHTQHLPEIE